jgi:hypothetical protein
MLIGPTMGRPIAGNVHAFGECREIKPIGMVQVKTGFFLPSRNYLMRRIGGATCRDEGRHEVLADAPARVYVHPA